MHVDHLWKLSERDLRGETCCCTNVCQIDCGSLIQLHAGVHTQLVEGTHDQDMREQTGMEMLHLFACAAEELRTDTKRRRQEPNAVDMLSFFASAAKQARTNSSGLACREHASDPESKPIGHNSQGLMTKVDS